jgi:cytochrome P450
MSSQIANAPVRRSDVDLFSDAVLKNPYPHYRALRELGAAVYLQPCGVWALTRHSAVRDALDDWRVFSSTDGIALNDTTNQATSGSPLAADPPAHRAPRRVLAQHLSPMAVREQAPEIQARAERLCARVLAQGPFDAVADLARPFALSVLADHVGLPAEGRAALADWADAAFDIIGPESARTQATRAHLGELGVHLLTVTTPERLTAAGAGHAIYTAGARGDLAIGDCAQLIVIYLLASIPTSTAAIASAVWLFAHHPEQWDALRSDPQLLPGAVEEVLRLESPIQSFSRVLRTPQDIDGVTLPAGARVLLLFGSANRDERAWQRADSFDIARKHPADHLAFGRGLHSCSGQGLARVQVSAVLAALIPHVERWEAGDARWKLNNTIRGLDSFPVAVNGSGRPGPLAAPRTTQGGAATQVSDWRLTGTIGLAKLRRSVALPPDATFSGALDMVDGTMSGAMELPMLSSAVELFGMDIGVTSQLIPTGAFDGQIAVDPDGTIDIRATSRAHMHIRALRVGRLTIRLNCRTVTPIEMPLHSSGTMSLDFRPSFSGTMTIPRLRGSGPIGWILSLLVSGPNNPFQIALELPTPDAGDDGPASPGAGRREPQ